MDGWLRHRLHQTSAQEPHRTTLPSQESRLALRDQIQSDPGETNHFVIPERDNVALPRILETDPQHHHLTGCILGLSVSHASDRPENKPSTIPPARKLRMRI
jgi:hypothetical protein